MRPVLLVMNQVAKRQGRHSLCGSMDSAWRLWREGRSGRDAR